MIHSPALRPFTCNHMNRGVISAVLRITMNEIADKMENFASLNAKNLIANRFEN